MVTKLIFIILALLIFLWGIIPVTVSLIAKVLFDKKIEYFVDLTELGGSHDEKQEEQNEE